MLCESSSTTMDCTSAGDIALMTNCAGFASKGMMSTRSPAISFDTACTREPRMPTQAPTGSMRGSLLRTAILARTPGSRAAPRISMVPWPTSGTSSLNSSTRNSGAVRDRNSCGPRGSGRTSFRKALTRSCGLSASRRIMSLREMKPSALPPRSTNTPLRSTRLTTPLTSVLTRSLNCVDDLGALGLAHLLHHDLLGLLGSDAAEDHRLDRLLDEAARLGVLVDIKGVFQAQLAIRGSRFPWSRRQTPSSDGTCRSRRSCG